MAEAPHAVFLSYASQDAGAAQKIAEALRARDIEVFLDQSELRGGDAWDKKIRHEIHDCAPRTQTIRAWTGLSDDLQTEPDVVGGSITRTNTQAFR